MNPIVYFLISEDIYQTNGPDDFRDAVRSCSLIYTHFCTSGLHCAQIFVEFLKKKRKKEIFNIKHFRGKKKKEKTEILGG